MMRTYTRLEQEGVIYNKRGIGFFVSDCGRQAVERAGEWTAIGIGHSSRHFVEAAPRGGCKQPMRE